MAYPKWKYRKNPDLGFFQSTMVLTAEAEKELDTDWSDGPTLTGFKVRPATDTMVGGGTYDLEMIGPTPAFDVTRLVQGSFSVMPGVTT